MSTEAARRARIGAAAVAIAIGVASICLFHASAPVEADGVFGLNFACTDGEMAVTAPGQTQIDLGLAANAPWDAPSSGNGVYDAEKWAVVFKYSSVTIPIGRILFFKNHPSRAPIIWLVEGDVIIDGQLHLAGATPQGGFTGPGEPGPGGFRGGFGESSTASPSGGFGPGGAGVQTIENPNASGASHATVGARGNPDDETSIPGRTYGNSRILPLIGGSGGAAWDRHFSAPGQVNGGGGGGAILIVAGGTIRINGSIDASGGGSINSVSGAGSGGAIRLVAPSVSGTGRLLALGGQSRAGRGGDGRILIEADAIDLAQPGEPDFIARPLEDPPMPFPPPSAPRIRVVSVGGVAVGNDPHANFPFADVTLSTTESVAVILEAENLPLDSTVDVRFVPRTGHDMWIRAHLDPNAANSFEQSTWTTIDPANPLNPLLLPNGFLTVQARAELPDA